jgi:16S rRNA (cytidine1402-2'-O)-methyltransferase
MSSGKVFIVGTPIGNLEDMTLRGLRVLKEADLIAAEDTRHSSVLLQHFDIHKPLVSYHQFNEARRTAEFIEQLKAGKKIALVSDAGMPGISDPGERLVRACVQEGIEIEVVPGPSAVLVALVGAGFEMEPFHFGGFLPVKSGGRRKELMLAADRGCTGIYFESPHRLLRTLEAAAEVIPDVTLCVARELTKKFEELRRGTGAELLAHFSAQKVRGEICLVVRSRTKREKAALAEAGETLDEEAGGIDSITE